MIQNVHVMDLVYMLGFFMALALRRGRIDAMIGGMMEILPFKEKTDPEKE
jgi:hypothetical protein